MAPSRRKSSSKPKPTSASKKTVRSVKGTQHITGLLQTPANNTGAKITASTISIDVKAEMIATTQGETETTGITATNKRKIGDTDAPDKQEISPSKKRTMSSEGTPARRTRGQSRLLAGILDEDELQYFEDIVDQRQPKVKTEDEPTQADWTIEAIKTDTQIESSTTSDAITGETVKDDAQIGETTTSVALVKHDKQKKTVMKVNNKKTSMVWTYTKGKQSSLTAHLKKMPVHPESTTPKFLMVKLKYAKSGKFRMPLNLVKSIPFYERNVRNGILKVKPASPFWDNGTLNLKFGFSPYLHLPGPTPEQCAQVWALLDPWLRSRDPPLIIERFATIAENGPAHGTDGNTVDIFFRTIIAQATSNQLALQTQTIATHYFKYLVDGKKVVGDLPNYHAMRVATDAQLENAIRHSGLFRGKAQSIKNVLNATYDENTKRVMAANNGQIPTNLELGQAANQSTFVPGMLSLDFLRTMNQVEMFNWLEKQDGISHKTAACILEFNYGFPVCAVDVHVHKIARFLGWVPNYFDFKSTFRHLEGRIPDYLKHQIHQGFWHHSQHCDRCKGSLARNDTGKENMEPCVLEHLMRRYKQSNGAHKTEGDSVLKKKKRVTPASEKGPLASKAWAAFATPEEAALEGYEAGHVNLSDDFAAGSVNVNVIQQWFYVGFNDEEEEEI